LTRIEMVNEIMKNPKKRFRQVKSIDGTEGFATYKNVGLHELGNKITDEKSEYGVALVVFGEDESEWEEILPEPTISAIEFVYKFSIMCKMYKTCNGCPNRGNCEGRFFVDNVKAVIAVEKWAKENSEEESN